MPKSYPMLLILQKAATLRRFCLLFDAISRCHLRKLPFILAGILTWLCFSLNAQQNNIWYFGRTAGLNFNGGAGQPVPTLLENSAMIADEGSSTVSDANGQLLFYTNGIKVYNREHEVMRNGDDLDGDISACQSSLIIPVPGNDSLFYLFTSDAIENNFAAGYRYSIINMNRDNGKGELVSKNVLLWASCTERLTAARHANGVDIWVITNDNNSNIFRAWLITCNGLSSSPINSTVGEVMNQHVVTNTGFMKVSPDGKQLCQTHFPLFDPDVPGSNFFQLFDFDNATGLLSNGRSISTPNALYTSCEYSPDSKLLYLTRPYQKHIDQVEAKLSTPAAIAASTVKIPTVSPYHALQLGPDEKMYCFKREQSLGVINSPNTKGPNIDFREKQFILTPNSSLLGSPNFVNDIAYDPSNGFDYAITDSCDGVVQFNAVSTMGGTISWSWDFGDGQTSSQQNPTHTFTPSHHTYVVRLTISSNTGCGIIRRTRVVNPKLANINIRFDFIRRCDSGYIRFLNPNLPADPGDQFTWDFGDGNTSQLEEPVHAYAQPGNYIVQLTRTNPGGCRDASFADTIGFSQLRITVPNDQTIIIGQSVQLYVNGPVVTCQWHPSTGLNNPDIISPVATPTVNTTYKVMAVNKDGCESVDSVRVNVIDIEDIYVPTGFTPNNDGLNDDLRPFFGSKYSLKEFSIFTRWGERIFTTRERGMGWKGKFKGVDQASGVYVWMVRAVDTATGQSVVRKGTTMLLR